MHAAALARVLLAGSSLIGQERWQLAPDLHYSGLDSLQTAEFLTVAAGPDGRLYLTLVGDPSIHVFGPDGTYALRVGRAGQGPGEFRGAPLIGFVGDTLRALDPAAQRATLFAWTGDLIDTWDLRPLVAGASGPTAALRPMSMAPQGRILFRQSSPLARSARDARGETLLLQAQLLSGRVDTLAVLSTSTAVVRIELPQGAYLTLRHPWSFTDVVAVASNGRHIAVLSQPPPPDDDRAEYTVRIYDDRGTLRATVSHPYRPEVLTSNDIERYLAAKASDIVAAIPMSHARVMSVLRQATSFPRFRPPVPSGGRDPLRGRVVVSTDGYVWVAREKRGVARRWQVLRPNGTVLAHCELPDDLELLEVSSAAAWGAVVDSMGTVRLTRFRLIR